MKRPLNLFLCFLAPGLILLAGVFFAGNYRSREMPKLMQDVGTGFAPPGFSVELSDVGKYTLWLRTRTRYGGALEEYDGQLPEGGKVQLFDKVSGKELEVSTKKSKRSFHGEKAVCLGDFETIRNHQIIEIRASGLANPIVLSVAANRHGDSMSLLFHLLGILCVTLFLAFLALAIPLHRRKKKLEASPES